MAKELRMQLLGPTKLSSKIIDATKFEFSIKGWTSVLFINNGNVPVEILGITLENKDSIKFGGHGTYIQDEISITFDENYKDPAGAALIKKVVCVYEVLPTIKEDC